MKIRNRKKITIPKTCDKNWNDLEGEGYKKECSKCEKPVFDFSKKTDLEIISFIKQNKGKRVCGMFSTSQLNRDLKVSPWYLKPVTFILPSFFILNISNYSSQQELFNYEPQAQLITANSIQIKGKIIDQETQEPIIFANVFIKGTKIGTTTDIEGNFLLTFDANLLFQYDSLTITHIGYENKNIKIETNNASNFVIKLKPEMQILGEVIVTKAPFRKRFFKRKNT